MRVRFLRGDVVRGFAEKQTKPPLLSNVIDLQINGFAGIDFNQPDADIAAACEAYTGVERLLPTVITGSEEHMAACLRNIAACDHPKVAGIHIEGPFLNPADGFIGAHPREHAGPADVEHMKRLLEAADGRTRIVTLAPEMDLGATLTRFLVEQGIVVSAGHCDPDFDQLSAAIDAGLSMFTHLGNGCPNLLHRHDNIIQRVLSWSDALTISLIADGAHLPWFVLANFLELIPPENIVIVSDAIAAAGLGPGTYTLGGQSVAVGEDLVPRRLEADGRTGHFVGSGCPLPQMAERLREHLGLSDEEIEAYTLTNPGRLLR